MRRLALLVLTSFCPLIALGQATFAPPTYSKTTVSFYLGVGTAFPIGPTHFGYESQLYDDWTSTRALAVSSALGIHFLTIFEAQFLIDYTRFPFEQGPVLENIPNIRTEGGAKRFFNFALGLKVSLLPRSSISPYIRGYGGIFQVERRPLALINTNTGTEASIPVSKESAFGTGIGGGVSYKLSRNLGIFLESHYIIGFTPEESIRYVPLRIGIMLFGTSDE